MRVQGNDKGDPICRMHITGEQGMCELDSRTRTCSRIINVNSFSLYGSKFIKYPQNDYFFRLKWDI